MEESEVRISEGARPLQDKLHGEIQCKLVLYHESAARQERQRRDVPNTNDDLDVGLFTFPSPPHLTASNSTAHLSRDLSESFLWRCARSHGWWCARVASAMC